MFDDQQNADGVPGNLPMEPVDMFAGTEKDLPADEMPPEFPQTPNALSAGLLKKKDGAGAAPDMNIQSPSMSSGAMYEMKQPVLGKILLSVLLLAVLGGIGFGGWYFYNKFKNSNAPVAVPTVNTINTNQVAKPAVDNSNNIVADFVATNSVSSSEVSASMNNDKILFGESVDSDHDGLDDVREKQLGTNPNKADSDGDGLSDGDEVIIWKTNPLKADTDGDGYSDGSEVFHGYNPLGAGKLFNVPTSTSSTVNTSTTSTVSTTTASSSTVKSTTTKK
ncbi:MAG: hypothetical protein NT034_03135 [Candidatus Magasanikbacteria bacterium]|nr:hypothetical protein [Candidatus Magasanikbacteria bacterium]